MGITCTKLSLEQTDDKQLQSDAEDFNYSSAYEQLDVNYLPQFDIRKSTKATSPTEKILQQKQSLEKLRTISFRLQHSGHSTSSSSQDSSPVSLFPSKYSRTLSSSASTADSSNAPSIVLNTSNNSIILESSEDSSRVLTVNQALILACEQGDIDALVLMLVDPVYGMGINANLYNEKGETLLFIGSRNNHMKVVKALLEFGSSPNKRNSNNEDCPLLIAAEKGFVEIVAALLSSNALVDITQKKTGATALMVAASCGNLNVVRSLVEYGAQKDLTDRQGNTAMQRAAQGGHWSIVQYFWDKGANIWIPNKANICLMDLPNAKEHLLPLLSKKFWEACRQGEKELVHKYFIASWMHIDDMDEIDGLTPLMFAAQCGSITLVRYCIDRCKANINKVSRDQRLSPLHLAAVAASTSFSRQEFLLVARELMKAGANINAQTKHGLTPLMYACMEGNVDMVTYLLEYKANINAQDEEGNTALLWTLLSCLQRPSPRQGVGISVENYLYIAELLLEKGASVLLTNKHNEIPCILASNAGLSSSLVEALESSMIREEKARIELLKQYFTRSLLTDMLKLLQRAQYSMNSRQHQKLFHSIHHRLQSDQDVVSKQSEHVLPVSFRAVRSEDWSKQQTVVQDYIVNVSLFFASNKLQVLDALFQQEMMTWLEKKYEEILQLVQEMQHVQLVTASASSSSSLKGPLGSGSQKSLAKKSSGKFAKKEDLQYISDASSSTTASFVEHVQRHQKHRIQSMLQVLEKHQVKRRNSKAALDADDEDEEVLM